MKKKLLLFVCLLAVLSVLAGCANEKVRNVEKMIDNIGEVSSSSEETLLTIRNEYHALSDAEKTEVRNYEKFQVAEQKYKDIMTSSASTEVMLLGAYFMAVEDQEDREDKVTSVMNKYYEYMSEKDKETCLEYLGVTEALDAVIDEIRPRLKSPKSFHLYSADVWSSPSYEKSTGVYSVLVELNYGATNSYGGEITSTASAFYEFKIDIEEGCTYSKNVRLYFL